MNTKHTPGPWEVPTSYPTTVQASSPSEKPWICDMADSRLIRPEEAEANARRIVDCVNACEGIADPSAVPELLEALKALIEATSAGSFSPSEKRDAISIARTAIAKATGETI